MTNTETKKCKNQIPEYVPVSKFNEVVSPFPSAGAIRQLIFYNRYGFVDKVIRRINRRLYIRVPAFYEYVEETNGKKVSESWGGRHENE